MYIGTDDGFKTPILDACMFLFLSFEASRPREVH